MGIRGKFTGFYNYKYEFEYKGSRFDIVKITTPQGDYFDIPIGDFLHLVATIKRVIMEQKYAAQKDVDILGIREWNINE